MWLWNKESGVGAKVEEIRRRDLLADFCWSLLPAEAVVLSRREAVGVAKLSLSAATINMFRIFTTRL